MRPEPRLISALFPALLFAAVTWSCAPDPPHDQGERFPLEGKHEALPCEACHGTDGFEALPTDCASCHETDRPLNHYDGDCGECHNAFGWLNFGTGTGTTNPDPHQTTFPLVGAHDLACTNCHAATGFEGLDPACESCHDAERPPYHYQGDCASCHPISLWADGLVHRVTLPHHTAACENCHTDPFVRETFSCLDGCHEQGVTDALPLHVNNPSYLYDSTFCADCHFPI